MGQVTYFVCREEEAQGQSPCAEGESLVTKPRGLGLTNKPRASQGPRDDRTTY